MKLLIGFCLLFFTIVFANSAPRCNSETPNARYFTIIYKAMHYVANIRSTSKVPGDPMYAILHSNLSCIQNRIDMIEDFEDVSSSEIRECMKALDSFYVQPNIVLLSVNLCARSNENYDHHAYLLNAYGNKDFKANLKCLRNRLYLVDPESKLATSIDQGVPDCEEILKKIPIFQSFKENQEVELIKSPNECIDSKTQDILFYSSAILANSNFTTEFFNAEFEKYKSMSTEYDENTLQCLQKHLV
jgi:hypothetical protein